MELIEMLWFLLIATIYADCFTQCWDMATVTLNETRTIQHTFTETVTLTRETNGQSFSDIVFAVNQLTTDAASSDTTVDATTTGEDSTSAAVDGTTSSAQGYTLATPILSRRGVNRW